MFPYFTLLETIHVLTVQVEETLFTCIIGREYSRLTKHALSVSTHQEGHDGPESFTWVNRTISFPGNYWNPNQLSSQLSLKCGL